MLAMGQVDHAVGKHDVVRTSFAYCVTAVDSTGCSYPSVASASQLEFGATRGLPCLIGSVLSREN